jgi:hypothetical protein
VIAVDLASNVINPQLVVELADLSGVSVPEEDRDLLCRTVERYMELARPLVSAQLESLHPEPAVERNGDG